jgi:Subtilase family
VRALALAATALSLAGGTHPVTPNDPDYRLNAIAARDLALPQAWALTEGSPAVVIAVVDTGVNADADLAVASAFCVGAGCTGDDGNGHGTAMAHIAAGHDDNGIDGAGVCGRCRVMAVKVAGADGRFASDALAAGIRAAVAHGARVINLSLGPDPGEPPSSDVAAAVASALARGVSVVMAAGNLGLAAPSANTMASATPAAIRVANVAARTNALAPTSNRGP